VKNFLEKKSKAQKPIYRTYKRFSGISTKRQHFFLFFQGGHRKIYRTAVKKEKKSTTSGNIERTKELKIYPEDSV